MQQLRLLASTAQTVGVTSLALRRAAGARVPREQAPDVLTRRRGWAVVCVALRRDWCADTLVDHGSSDTSIGNLAGSTLIGNPGNPAFSQVSACSNSRT